MAADVELLPLPDCYSANEVMMIGGGKWVRSEEAQAYARANVEANTEALRQQRDFLVEEYERAVGCGQQGYTHAAMHLFNAIANAQVDQNANAIMTLRAEVERLTFEMGCLQQQYDERTAYMIVHRGSGLACSDAVRSAYSDEHHRAEQLAEALRRIEGFTMSQFRDAADMAEACIETAHNALTTVQSPHPCPRPRCGCGQCPPIAPEATT